MLLNSLKARSKAKAKAKAKGKAKAKATAKATSKAVDAADSDNEEPESKEDDEEAKQSPKATGKAKAAKAKAKAKSNPKSKGCGADPGDVDFICEYVFKLKGNNLVEDADSEEGLARLKDMVRSELPRLVRSSLDIYWKRRGVGVTLAATSVHPKRNVGYFSSTKDVMGLLTSIASAFLLAPLSCKQVVPLTALYFGNV